MGSTPVEGREGSISEQREKLICDIDPTTATAELMGSSGARMALQGCAKLG